MLGRILNIIFFQRVEFSESRAFNYI